MSLSNPLPPFVKEPEPPRKEFTKEYQKFLRRRNNHHRQAYNNHHRSSYNNFHRDYTEYNNHHRLASVQNDQNFRNSVQTGFAGKPHRTCLVGSNKELISPPDILTALVWLKLSPSKNKARRDMRNGQVKINGKICRDKKYVFTINDHLGNGCIAVENGRPDNYNFIYLEFI